MSMWRAKTRMLFCDYWFQMCMGGFICLGFLIDIAEAEVSPERGSRDEKSFYIMDCIITAIFTVQPLAPLLQRCPAHIRACLHLITRCHMPARILQLITRAACKPGGAVYQSLDASIS